MKADLIISGLTLVVALIIGIIQIRISINQKKIIDRLEIFNTKIQVGPAGIIGNSNKGNISDNKL